MKHSSKKSNWMAMLALITILAVFNVSPALGEPLRVAIIPFALNAEKDLAFLREGTMDMLESRLSMQDQTIVINEHDTQAALASVDGFDGQSRALLVGGKLQADYILFGSLTVIGQSVSIDATMVDVKGQKQPLHFFTQTPRLDGVIPQINTFATRINETIFGRTASYQPPVTNPKTATPSTGQASPTPRLDQSNEHPQSLIESGGPDGSQTASAGNSESGQTPNPAFVATAPANEGTHSTTFWRSRTLHASITGLCAADVDNDSRQEVIIVSKKMRIHQQGGA